MKPTRNSKPEQTLAFVGGGLGLAIFLVVGLLPSVVYGGYAGVILANSLFETAIHTSVWAQAIVIFGVLVGVLSTGALFVFVGAALGAGLALALGVTSSTEETAEEIRS